MRLYQINKRERMAARLVIKTKIIDAILRLATFIALIVTASAFNEKDSLTRAAIVSIIALSCFVVGVYLCMKSERRLSHAQDMLEFAREQKAGKASI